MSTLHLELSVSMSGSSKASVMGKRFKSTLSNLVAVGLISKKHEAIENNAHKKKEKVTL